MYHQKARIYLQYVVWYNIFVINFIMLHIWIVMQHLQMQKNLPKQTGTANTWSFQ